MQLVTLTQEAQKEIANLSLSEFWDVFADVDKNDGELAARSLLIERCAHDVEAFALAFFPHYCVHDWNEFHSYVFSRWKKDLRARKGKVRRADAAPRGAAKSTLITLIKPIHDLCYGIERFIVIISNTAAQSAGRTKDIRSELLDNDLLIRVYGRFFGNPRVAETQFVARCRKHYCKFLGVGSGTELRGIRFGAARPSKIILDDVEHSEEVENEEIRSKQSAWFKEAVSKLGDEHTGIEVIGTILHKQSLLSNLLINPAYSGKKFKAIETWSSRGDLWEEWRQIYIDLDNPTRLNDAQEFYRQHEREMTEGTQILWPAKETYLDLMEEMIEIGRRAFMKERQNEPLASDMALFDDIGWYRETEEGLLIEETRKLIPWKHLSEAYGAIDPATGQTKPRVGKKGDFSCILTGYQDDKGRVFVHRDWTKRAKPTEFIQQIFNLNDEYHYAVFGVETNLFRELLLPNIQAERERREKKRKKENGRDWGIKVRFKDIVQTENKLKRIHTLEPKIKNRYVLFNRRLSVEFRNQLEAFPDPGSHDDGPDCLEILVGLFLKRFHVGPVRARPQRDRG